LLNNQQSCENNCIFCFIDQLPKGMRKSLYYKDDDVRLSFLHGNYVTLTNLSRMDIKRIIKMRISPVNISVHSLEPKIRLAMLRNKNSQLGIKHLLSLVKAGISLNCQIVCCPDINDGIWLNRTLRKLMRLGNAINSVSIVPVGLTKYRDGLTKLKPFDKELARETITQVERIAKISYTMTGKRVFYCSDELYIMAGLRLPSYGFYEDFPQLENGVGMMRLFMSEFRHQLESKKDFVKNKITPTSIVTGKLAAKYIKKLLSNLKKWYDDVPVTVYTINNDFFGNSVTVSGLITGKNIIDQLKDKELASRLLIPQNMLKSGEELFLDDVTVDELSKTLNIPVKIVKIDGADFLNTIIN